MDLFNYEQTESCFRRTVSDWLDLVTSRILKPRIMIVPTHLDEFEASNDSNVRNRCEDILDRVQRYCKSQKALIEFEISEKKKKGLKNSLKGGSDPEWKKNNPPIISSVLVSAVLSVSYYHCYLVNKFVWWAAISVTDRLPANYNNFVMGSPCKGRDSNQGCHDNDVNRNHQALSH